LLGRRQQLFGRFARQRRRRSLRKPRGLVTEKNQDTGAKKQQRVSRPQCTVHRMLPEVLAGISGRDGSRASSGIYRRLAMVELSGPWLLASSAIRCPWLQPVE